MTNSSPSNSDRPNGSADENSFNLLHERVQRWVWNRKWTKLRDIQSRAIRPILESDRDVILAAGTAAGKTEAAFMPLCSQLVDDWDASIRVLCVSPLKALINDQFQRLEDLCGAIDAPVYRWHGDVTATQKRKATETPGGVLLITPESLEALFVVKGRVVPTMFRQLRAVVLDELHAYIGSARGRQLQSLLHRLELVLGRRVRRIGLSATLGDMSLAAKFLRAGQPELVEVIESSSDGKDVLLQLRGYREVAPRSAPRKTEADNGEDEESDRHVEEISEHLFDRLRGGHHLVFANARSSVEKYSDRLRRLSERQRVPNEFFPHHGSLSKELREDTEARLKDRSMPATAICTSTLELGIDIGDVESIAQIGAPSSVASLRQRLGRSGRRDKPPTLRLYVSEPEITPKSSVLDTLHTELVQAIAMVDLLLEHWCEPPDLGALHLSTLVQQVMSVIAQHGGVSAAKVWSALCDGGPFVNVDQRRFALLLRNMAGAGLIEQVADGDLVLAEKGERIVEHFSFFAVFTAPEEFRVEHAGRSLGSLSFDGSLVLGMHIIFAGRRWKLIGIDSSARVLSVEPAPGGRTPRFEGSRGGLVHDQIRVRMRLVYESTETPSYLNAIGRELLAEARSAYVRLGLHGVSIVRDGSDALLFLCRGDRIVGTSAVLLVARGLDVEVTGPAIIVQRTTPDALSQQLRSICAAPAPSGDELAARVVNKSEGKYDWALDESLLCAEYAARSLSVDEAIRALGGPAEIHR